MRYILVILLLAIWPNHNMHSQNIVPSDAMFLLIKKHFNAQAADSLYELTGEAFRAKIKKDNFAVIAKNNLFPLGQIKEWKLLNNANGNITYKLTCEQLTVELHFNLDEKGKLKMFLFKPFKEIVAQKMELVVNNNAMSTELDLAVHKAASGYMQQLQTVGLSIGVIQDGKMYIYDYGETAKGNKTLPNENTIFEIGSLTKTFTATLLAYYVNFKKLKLEDPISKYLPDTVAANEDLKHITVEMLANHTSGLPRLPDNLEQYIKDTSNPYKYYTQDAMYSFLKMYKVKQGSEPGKVYDYSNLGAGLLGQILEKVSGKNYNEMLLEVICKPLQMNGTNITITKKAVHDIAHVYTEQGIETPMWDMASMQGAGAIKSNMHDMLIYAKAQLNCNQGPLENAFQLTHIITYNDEPKIGLGWHQLKLGVNEILWHNGGTYGSSSYMGIVPTKKIAVVVLSNSAISADEVATHILTTIVK